MAMHKVYGPEQNDLVLQLRKRGINKIILAGMSANLCVERKEIRESAETRAPGDDAKLLLHKDVRRIK